MLTQSGWVGTMSPRAPTAPICGLTASACKGGGEVGQSTNLALLCRLLQEPVTKYRADYTATPFLVDSIYLNFVLNEDVTHVHSTIAVRPNYDESAPPPAMVLDGRKDIDLVSVKVGVAAVVTAKVAAGIIGPDACAYTHTHTVRAGLCACVLASRNCTCHGLQT